MSELTVRRLISPDLLNHGTSVGVMNVGPAPDAPEQFDLNLREDTSAVSQGSSGVRQRRGAADADDQAQQDRSRIREIEANDREQEREFVNNSRKTSIQMMKVSFAAGCAGAAAAAFENPMIKCGGIAAICGGVIAFIAGVVTFYKTYQSLRVPMPRALAD